MVKPIVNQVTNSIPYFEYFSQKVLPAVYDDSLSYYETLSKVVNQLNDIGILTNETVDKWNEVSLWIVGEGLQESTAEEIGKLLADGTLEGLISDGILVDIQAQLSGKASTSDLATIQAQISTLIANSTATEGNAELLDSRISSTGKTYATVGEHIRTNDSFHSATRDLATEFHTYMPILSSYSYVDKNTLVLTAHSSYALTVPVDCNFNDEFLVTTYISGPLVGTAVMYDVNNNVLGVLGPFGNNTLNAQTSLIRITNKDCKFVAFQVATSLRPQLMIRRKVEKTETIETMKQTRGYYHVNAKNRAGFSDRNQVWLTWDLGENAAINPIVIPFELIKNIKGVNYRLFGGLTPTTYEATLDNYSTWIGEGIYNYLTTGRTLTMPVDPTSTAPTRYLQLFIDGVLTDTTQPGELYIPKFQVNGKDPINVILNVPQAGDKWSDVAAFAATSPLYKKTMVGIGDSLMIGSVSGETITWFNKLGKKLDMTYVNYGDSGDTVANQTQEPQNPGMVNRYMNMLDNADYITLIGGANDRRLNIPLGENDSRDINTFKGALNVIIDGLFAKYPRGKILFMTNYNRFPDSVNSLGLSDWSYCEAMIDVCRLRGVQVYDNYHLSGINFTDPNLLAWQDEGIADIDGVKNTHISDEAYTWLLPKYQQALEGL